MSMIRLQTSLEHPCQILSNATWQAIPLEAKFIADQLMEQGIPAIADKIGHQLGDGGSRCADMDPRSVCERMTFHEPKPGSKPTSSVASPRQDNLD